MLNAVTGGHTGARFAYGQRFFSPVVYSIEQAGEQHEDEVEESGRSKRKGAAKGGKLCESESESKSSRVESSRVESSRAG